jgi:WD40 repeat protein
MSTRPLKRWDSKTSGDKDNGLANGTEHYSNGSERTFTSLSVEDENAQLKRRIAQLETENEKLKASVFLLSERYTKRRDSKEKFPIDVLLAATSTPPSIAPSPNSSAAPFPPYPPPRRQSAEVASLSRQKDVYDGAVLVSRQSKDIYDEDSEDGQASVSSNEPTTCRSTLTGHKSAVYACKFSLDGSSIASTSLDNTVRLWNLNSGSSAIIGQHASSGTDLAWEGSRVVTSSVDMTVCVWDTGKINPDVAVQKFRTNGVALCTTICDSNIIVAGTSNGYLHRFDSRQPSSETSSSQVLEAAVNAVCFGESNLIFTGDAKGNLRAWDTRITRSEDLCMIEGRKPISGIAYGGKSYLAVNSYDNALRIYCRDSAELVRLTHTLRGHKSKGWPIRSCFSQGSSLMVATGSSTNSCYLFGTLPYNSPNTDESLPQVSLLQLLQGHTGSVYATDFSNDNHLATCSADGTIKIWWRRW